MQPSALKLLMVSSVRLIVRLTRPAALPRKSNPIMPVRTLRISQTWRAGLLDNRRSTTAPSALNPMLIISTSPASRSVRLYKSSYMMVRIAILTLRQISSCAEQQQRMARVLRQLETITASYRLGSVCYPFTGGYIGVMRNSGFENKYKIEVSCSTAVLPECPNVILPKQYCEGPCVGAIIDAATISYSIDVPLNEIIDDLNVRVNLTHTYDADLDIFLITPAGRFY